MTKEEVKIVKDIQKEIRKLYDMACDGKDVSVYLEALDFIIERDLFGYDGD